MRFPRVLLSVLWSASIAAAQGETGGRISLTIPSGAPLRVYLTGKAPIRPGAPVHARVIEPVFTFDREAIPAGADVAGRVLRVTPVPRWQRFQALVNGDFTPLRRAQIEFTSVTPQPGRTLELHTLPSAGLNSIYTPPRPPRKPARGGAAKPDNGALGIGKQTARDQINQRVNARTRGLAEVVRGPNKRERLMDFVMAKLPYHPQWVRRGTRFDAELTQPLEFGSVPAASSGWDLLGTQPPPDSAVRARLLESLDSAWASLGRKVEAVVAEPLFSPDRRLILPEGTQLTGSVVMVHKARWFHRGGRLRFSFLRFDLPPQAATLQRAQRAPAPAAIATAASLAGAESGGKASLRVDEEGGVKATESKTRFLAPLAALMVANKAADNDAGRQAATGGEANVSGRTLGGVSGFGLLGARLWRRARSTWGWRSDIMVWRGLCTPISWPAAAKWSSPATPASRSGLARGPSRSPLSTAVTFLGIDLGWYGKPSGLASLRLEAGGGLLLHHVARLESADAILAWVAEEAGDGNAVAGIDAPLVIPNASGIRRAERELNREFRRFHAGCHAANLGLPFAANVTGFSRRLLSMGYRHGAAMPARAPGRYQIEVHPHAATVSLFGLDRIVKYKRGTREEKARGLRRLRALMLARLPSLDPPLLPQLPGIPRSGPLKPVEDQIDAVMCAYIAAYWWCWGARRNRCYGGEDEGCIVVPRPRPV